MNIGKYNLVYKPGEILNKPNSLCYILLLKLLTLEQEGVGHVGDKNTGNNSERKMPGIEKAGPYYPESKEYEKGDDILQTLPLLLYKGTLYHKKSVNANLKNSICQIFNHYLFINIAYYNHLSLIL